MSSVIKVTNSQYLYGCFRLPDGRRTMRSTKTRDPRKALEVVAQWEAASKSEMSATQVQRVLCEVYQSATGTAVPSYTVKQFLVQWLERKVPEVAASSSEKYRYAIGEFITHLGPRADGPLLRVTEADLTSFRDVCAKKTRAKTTNGKLVVLAAAFREAWMDGYIPDNIAKRLKKLKVRQQDRLEKQPFTQQQVDSIIAAADGEWKGIVAFGAYTGQRLGDIVNLRWGDIHPSGVRFVSRKTGKPMSIPLAHPVLVDWLKANGGAHDAKAPLFPQSLATYAKNGQKVAALSKQFRVLLSSLGYAAKREYRVQGKGRSAVRSYCPLSFHSFRHYLTSAFYGAGVAGAVVREIIGHDSEYVSRMYTHIDEQAKRLALEQLAKAQKGARPTPAVAAEEVAQ